MSVYPKYFRIFNICWYCECSWITETQRFKKCTYFFRKIHYLLGRLILTFSIMLCFHSQVLTTGSRTTPWRMRNHQLHFFFCCDYPVGTFAGGSFFGTCRSRWNSCDIGCHKSRVIQKLPEHRSNNRESYSGLGSCDASKHEAIGEEKREGQRGVRLMKLFFCWGFHRKCEWYGMGWGAIRVVQFAIHIRHWKVMCCVLQPEWKFLENRSFWFANYEAFPKAGRYILLEILDMGSE